MCPTWITYAVHGVTRNPFLCVPNLPPRTLSTTRRPPARSTVPFPFRNLFVRNAFDIPITKPISDPRRPPIRTLEISHFRSR